jgi:hypothetical protein
MAPMLPYTSALSIRFCPIQWPTLLFSRHEQSQSVKIDRTSTSAG